LIQLLRHDQCRDSACFLDQLIAEGAVPPLVGVFVSSMSTEIRNKELPCNTEFLKFLSEELFPFINSKISVTADPALTLAAGSSFGGLATLYCGIKVPERFGLVLSQAASAAWSPEKGRNRGYILRLVEEQIELSGRFYLGIGAREMYLCENCDRPATIAHRELVELVRQRCSDVHSLEYEGSHDYACWRYSLPVGLKWLFAR
jgi:enterochelin esterase-like enzyme